MSPNKKSDEFLHSESSTTTTTSSDSDKKNEIKEILYNGEYYNVTNWIKKHPGGSIIDYYTGEGEDATHAIQQFHQRSSKKVMAIMNSMKKRKAEPKDYKMTAEQLNKHQALTSDFTKLYLELERDGMFKPSYTHLSYRFIELIIMWYIGYSLLFYSNIWIQFFGIIVIGITQGRSGWIQHESGHRSITGVVKWDQIIHTIIFGLGLGLSSTWWARGHNRHHAMPQRLKHDVDLDTLPLIAYNAKVIKNTKQGKSFLIQNQVYLFLLIDTLLGTLIWQFYLHPKYVLKHGFYFQLVSMLGHYVFAYYIGFWPWLISTWIMSMYLFGNFALSHTHLPVTSEPTHWVEYSLIHTADVESSWWCDWWMGYLNYQIEHHLFPTMPQFRHPQIHKKVRELAERHGIPYRVFTYSEAVKKTFENLKNVSSELKDL